MPTASAPSRSSIHDPHERRPPRRGRGAREFSCETCGKVYRHPNCLVKHRWEHNPYWSEASQFLLSKHQQVQLMEAAAILTRGRSLPTDRALWPSYMSDGALPSPAVPEHPTSTQDITSFRSSSPTESTQHHPAVSDDDDDDDEEDDIPSDPESLDEQDQPEHQSHDSHPPLHPYPTRHRPSLAHRATAPVDIRRASVGPARTYDSRSSMPYSPYRPPRTISSPRWSVIGEPPHNTPNLAISPPTGHRAGLDHHQSAHPITPTIGKPMPVPAPMPIPAPHSPYSGAQSFSSFSSITQSFGSSSTSSHIPSSSIRSMEAEQEEDDDYPDASLSHYPHAAPWAGSNGLKWSPPQPAPRTVYEDVDELEMDMDMD